MWSLFPDKKRSYIWYADQPPLLGGIPRKVSLEEFMAIYVSKGGKVFEYTETLWSALPAASFPPKVRSPDIERAAQETVKLLKTPKTDKFVIAYISPEVGFGVFAREKINRSEPLSIYAGVIAPEKSIVEEEYCYNLEGGHSVDAHYYGNISRFFQHLPADPSRFVQAMREAQEEKYQIIAAIQGHAAMNQAKQKDEATLMANVSEDVGWEFERLRKRSPPALLQSIAVNNAICIDLYVGNYPVKQIMAIADIPEGHMIGINYNLDYWSQGMFPKLFYPNGIVVPENEYKYDHCYIFIDHKNKKAYGCTYNTYMLNIDEQPSYPIEALNKFLSFFYLRDRLVENNVLSKAYAKLELNAFAIDLQKLLRPYNIFVKCYYHNPEAQEIIDRYNVDVVCQALSTAAADAFWNVVDTVPSPIAKCCQYNTNVNEIIIRSVNLHTEEVRMLLNKLRLPLSLHHLSTAKAEADRLLLANVAATK